MAAWALDAWSFALEGPNTPDALIEKPEHCVSGRRLCGWANRHGLAMRLIAKMHSPLAFCCPC